MGYTRYSSHANTSAGSSDKEYISSNEYSPLGRRISYPVKYSLFVNKQSRIDGTFTVQEQHEKSEIVNNRLYLDHRPFVDSNGGTSITVSDGGTIQAINAAEGYIELSNLPSADPFTVTYTAAPDNVSPWHINILQDAVMEIQKVIGITNNTSENTIQSTKFAIFDAYNSRSVLPQAVYLSGLNQDIVIASTNDGGGTSHYIQIGDLQDTVNIRAPNIHLTGNTADLSVVIGTRTGDYISFKGALSGAGQVTIGGPEWGSMYSGTKTTVTGAKYDNAMLRVNGDIACLGSMNIEGPVTILHSTGEQSSIRGDFQVGDELTVIGKSHLIGDVDTNKLTVQENLYIERDIVANNVKGSGSDGHSVIDGLDCSEVAHTYKWLNKKFVSNSVVEAPFTLTTTVQPIRTIHGATYTLSGSQTCGDVFALAGILTQAYSPSGAYDVIWQANFTSNPIPMAKGFVRAMSTSGLDDGGIWSDGLVDPMSLRIRIVGGESKGYDAPIYAHTIEQATTTSIEKVNLFAPAAPSTNQSASDPILIYAKGCEPYSYVSASGGSTPTATVTASATDPLVVAFDDDIRVLTSTVSNIQIKTALDQSVSGLAGTPKTGECFLFASKANAPTDPEASPSIIVRANPLQMPDEVLIGSVVASTDGASWTIEQTHSVRPGGLYDSSWIPVSTSTMTTSGRMVPALTGEGTSPEDYTRVWFYHGLGGGLDISRISATLYLADYGSKDSHTVRNNHHAVNMHSLWGSDAKAGFGLSGALTSISLHGLNTTQAKEAEMFYLDDKVIGIRLENKLLSAPEGNNENSKYLRLVIKRIN